jgi:hypothetical protein
MALISLEEAKGYLRVDAADEDAMISTLLSAAERLCVDVARFTDDIWEEVNSNSDNPSLVFIRESMKVAILYTLAYLYEHREEADHSELTRTLRSLLLGVRREVF